MLSGRWTMPDTIEQMQAKVTAAIAQEFPEAKEPAKEVAPRKPEPVSDADDGDAAPEVSPVQKARAESEASARAKGWVPKDEWIAAGHDEDDWKPAKQFIAKGEEIEERKSMRKTLDSLKKQNEEMAAILKRKLEAEANAERARKLAERDAAIRSGDVNKVHAIEGEIAQVPQVDVTPAEIREFVQENKEWWGVDLPATQAAVAYYGKLERSNPNDLADNLSKTKKFLALRFPDLFPSDRSDAAEAAQAMAQQQPATRKFSSVSVPSSADAGIRRGKQWSDLPADARRVADQIVKSGAMTRDQYVKEFFGAGE